MVSKCGRSGLPWAELGPAQGKCLERRRWPWRVCSVPESLPDCAYRDRPRPTGYRASPLPTGENVAVRPQAPDWRGYLWGYSSSRCSWFCIPAAPIARSAQSRRPQPEWARATERSPCLSVAIDEPCPSAWARIAQRGSRVKLRQKTAPAIVKPEAKTTFATPRYVV